MRKLRIALLGVLLAAAIAIDAHLESIGAANLWLAFAIVVAMALIIGLTCQPGGGKSASRPDRADRACGGDS